MVDLDDAEDLGEEVEDTIERRHVLGGVLGVLGIGGGGFLLLQGGGDGEEEENESDREPSGPSPLESDVTGTPAPGYVESFEDGDLTEYDTAEGGVVIDSRRAYHGEGSLHLRSANGSVWARTDSLSSLPSAGDTFRYRFYPTPLQSDGGANFTFARGENGRGYQIVCSFWKGFVGLARKSENDKSFLAKKDVNYEGDRWYVVDVEWTEGAIRVRLGFDGGPTLATVSASDDTYSSGGVEFQAWANTYRLNVFYDALEVV